MRQATPEQATPASPLEVLVYLVLGLSLLIAALPDLLAWISGHG